MSEPITYIARVVLSALLFFGLAFMVMALGNFQNDWALQMLAGSVSMLVAYMFMKLDGI